MRNPSAIRVLAACAMGVLAAAPVRAAAPDAIRAIGVETQYADVIAQIGGPLVHTGSIENDPNTDPHSFEASPSVAREVADAQLLVENGLGYDSWADRILAAAPSKTRRVIDVQRLLGLPDSTPNPHLWYDPNTMPAVANAVADALAALAPAHAADFRARAKAFVASLAPWTQAIATFKAAHHGTPLATTEPVGDYLLQAMGGRILTPSSLETAVMNGTDPSPQDVSAQNALFDRHAVTVFVYNQQVTDALTEAFLARARRNAIPVVAVYETMPAGFTYQSWMLAQVQAVARAVRDKVSTTVLAARP